MEPNEANLLREIAGLTRISNLPTVWTNVLVGLAAGQATTEGAPGVLDASLVVLAASCFYLGGMVLNDVCDYAYDAEHKFERPLPAGRISRRGATWLAVSLLAGGLIPLLFFDSFLPLVVGVVLVGSIVGYDLWHRHSAWAVVLMGGARTLVVLMTASAYFGFKGSWWGLALPLSLILGLYVVGITLIARLEDQARQDARRFGAIVMIGLVLGLTPCIGLRSAWWLTTPALALVTAWLVFAAVLVFRQPPQTGRAVSTWLAGICLVDLWFLILLGNPLLATIAGACFILTRFGHRFISGT